MLIRFTPNSLAGQSYQPRSKLNPLTLYEGLSLGLGALGGFLGSSNTSSTNKMNLRIARENNAFNERMFDRQIAYNWEMFNAENDYNSPQAQVQRYIDAGINPALAMEGQSAATAQGGSASQAASAGNPNMVPYDPAASFERMADILYKHELRDLELKKASLDVQDRDNEVAYNAGYRRVMMERGLQALRNEVTSGLMSRQLYDELRESWPLRKSGISEDLRLKRGEADYKDTLIAAQVLENKLKDFHLQKAPEEFKAQMSLIGAQIQAALASGKMSLAMASKAYAEAAEAASRQFGVDLDNKQKKVLFWSNVSAGLSKNISDIESNRNESQYQSDIYRMFNDPNYVNDTNFERRLRTFFGTVTSPVKSIFR